MIELTITYTDNRHDYQNRNRKLTVKADEKLSIQALIDNIVDKLELKKYDAKTQKYIRYHLKGVGQDGKEKIIQDGQLNNGNQLILEGLCSENPIFNSEFGLAVITVGGSWSVKELNEFLFNLDIAYSAIFASNEIILDSERTNHRYYENDITSRHKRIVANMGAHEQLRINKININSPGIIEVIGALNPLETIRQIFKDRQEAKIVRDKLQYEKEKDEKYRNAIEQAKSFFELEILKNQVAKERMAVLRDAGFSQEDLRPYVKQFIEKPLEELLVFQEQKKVEIAKVVSIGAQQIEIINDTSIDENNQDNKYMLPYNS